MDLAIDLRCLFVVRAAHVRSLFFFALEINKTESSVPKRIVAFGPDINTLLIVRVISLFSSTLQINNYTNIIQILKKNSKRQNFK